MLDAVIIAVSYHFNQQVCTKKCTNRHVTKIFISKKTGYTFYYILHYTDFSMFLDVESVYYTSLVNMVYRTNNFSRMITAFLVCLKIYI